MSPAISVTAAGPIFILNGHSVRVENAQALIARISDEFNVTARVIVTKRGEDIAVLAARAATDNCRAVVAGGGDGTVNAVAGKLAGTALVLGVLPMGTLNHFARDIGIPRDLEAAVRNVFSGHVIEVDVGEVNGRIFVNNSGLGFYPHFVRQREEFERHGYVKRIAFMLALRSIVRRYFRLRLKVRMDQTEALEHVTPFLFVGNNRYQTSGPKIGTRSRLDLGRLWVCTAPQRGRRKLLRTELRTLVGDATDKELNAFETEELWVETDTTRVNVSTDGEVSLVDSPLRYRNHPRALRVIVPTAKNWRGHPMDDSATASVKIQFP